MSSADSQAQVTPEQLFQDIMTYVEQATASVETRDMANLAGMDTMVDALCQRILALDTESGKAFEPHLGQVLTSIAELQEKMVKLQGEVKTTLKSLNTTKKANQAYKNAPEG
jgi:hypothetical protein